MSDEEKVLNAENWKTEASAVARDIGNHVNYIQISEKLQSNNACIYFNITTIENQNFCIELSAQGFRVVGTTWDVINTMGEDYFETPYSLLNKISSGFKNSFAKVLSDKLKNLEQ